MIEPTLSQRCSERLAAEAWAEAREPLDRQLSPLGLRAIEALAPRRGEVILDVGCGTGQTVLQLGALVGPEGRVVGVDRAPHVLDIARDRAIDLGQVSFILGDAATLDLPDDSIDAVYSRFGVMAFPDPAAAFANFHRMLRRPGRLAFVCWRSLHENELDLLPLQAAALEHRVDPTPFSFAEPSDICAVLQAAGFQDIGIVADDQAVTCGDIETTTMVLLKVGPLGRIVRENPSLSAAAGRRVRAALAAKGDPISVALAAATWIVTARA